MNIIFTPPGAAATDTNASDGKGGGVACRNAVSNDDVTLRPYSHTRCQRAPVGLGVLSKPWKTALIPRL